MLTTSENPAALAGANGANKFSHGKCSENVAGAPRSRKSGPAQLFRLRPDLARAFKRRAELARLVAFRREHGVWFAEPEPEVWARLVAELVCQQFSDPDFDHFRRAAGAIGVDIDPDLAVEKLHAICRQMAARGAAWRPVGAERAAAVLSVTAHERCACAITTIGAVDESKRERASRLDDERRERDRLRKRLARAEAKRTRAGRIAREVVAAESQKASTVLKIEILPGEGRGMRPAPWKEIGVSRATYYRRLATGREAAREADAEIVALSETDLPSLQKSEGKLTDHRRSQPAVELVSNASGHVCDRDEADLVLRRAARRALDRTPRSHNGEEARVFIRRCGEVDREIIGAVGVHRWCAMGDLVLDGRLSRQTLEAVLARAGLADNVRSIAA